MSSVFRPLASRLIKAQTVGSLSGAISDLGGAYISGTDLHNGNWSEIQVITTAVLDATTKSNITGLTTVSLPAGTRLQGLFSQIKLTSGTIIAYNATLLEQ